MTICWTNFSPKDWLANPSELRGIGKILLTEGENFLIARPVGAERQAYFCKPESGFKGISELELSWTQLEIRGEQTNFTASA